MGGVNEMPMVARPVKCKRCGQSGPVNPKVRKSWDGVCSECRKEEHVEG